MARSPGSAVARQRLGKALREMREQANVRIGAAAARLECSTAKISRLENGLGPAKNVEIAALMDLYGVDDQSVRKRIDGWATQTKAAGWWEADAELLDDEIDRYLGVETEASLMKIYCTPVLPTILHTASYGRAQIGVRHPDFSPAEVDRAVELRLARQRALLEPQSPLKLFAVVEEGAIRRQVGGAAVHAEQLAWLSETLDGLAAAGRDDIDLRILPFSAGAPGRALSPFVLFNSRQPDVDPVTAFVEDTRGGTWYDAADHVAPLSDLFDFLVGLCLDPTSSRRMLRGG